MFVVRTALLAFALRLAWGLAVQPSPTADVSDISWYHDTAVGLAHGAGYVHPYTGAPTALWPPGYPAILAAVYVVVGASPKAALAVNAVAGALTCILSSILGWRVTRSRVAARAVAVTTAILPSHIFFAPLLLSETIFTTVLCALAVIATGLLNGSARPRALAWIGVGMGAGCAALIRSEGAVLAVIPPLVDASLGHYRRAARIAALVVVGAALAIAPWAWRNFRVFGAFVPTSTNTGRAFWIGHNPDANGAMSAKLQQEMDARFEHADAGVPRPIAEVRLNRRYLDAAIDWAREHPREEVELLFLRTFHLWRGDHAWSSWYDYDYGTDPPLLSSGVRVALERLGNAYYVVLLVVGVLGLVARIRSRNATARFLIAVVASWSIIFAGMHADPRYHFPLLPILAVFAADFVASHAAPSKTAPY